MDLDKAFKIPSYLVIESGSSRPKPDEVKSTLKGRGARNALFSLADAEWHMSIKKGRSPALLVFFFIVLAMLRCVARRYQGDSLTLLESCQGCCWSRYDAEPEICDENSASLMTSLDASRMYDSKKKELKKHKQFCYGITDVLFRKA